MSREERGERSEERGERREERGERKESRGGFHVGQKQDMEKTIIYHCRIAKCTQKYENRNMNQLPGILMIFTKIILFAI